MILFTLSYVTLSKTINESSCSFFVNLLHNSTKNSKNFFLSIDDSTNL